MSSVLLIVVSVGASAVISEAFRFFDSGGVLKVSLVKSDETLDQSLLVTHEQGRVGKCWVTSMNVRTRSMSLNKL